MTLFSQLVPNASLVTANSTQTLTNKTLTSPTLTGSTSFTGPYHNSYLTQYGSMFIEGTSTNNIVQVSSLGVSTGGGLWSTGVGNTLFSNAGLYFKVGTTLRDQDTPTGGTIALNIDGSGNVGIGVTPSASSAKLLQLSDGAILGTAGNNVTLAANAYYANSGWRYASASTASTYQQINGAHYWYTTTSGAVGGLITFSEQMRITSGGFVGIGTTAPSSRLNVIGHNEFSLGVIAQTSSAQTTFLNHPVAILGNTNATVGNGLGLRYQIADTGGVARTAGGFGMASTAKDATSVTADMYFYTGTTEKMRITSAGNVGIGASAPIAYSGYSTLTVENTNGGVLHLRNSANTTKLEMAITASSAYISSIDALPLVLSTTNTERMRITSAGNVGIGTSAPGKKLDVVGQLRISGSAASGYALLEYGTSATATNNWHVGSEGDGTFRWYNGTFGAGTERMRINSAGNIGIGTNNPGTWRTYISQAGSDLLYLYNSSGTGVSLNMADQGWAGGINMNSGNLLFNAGGITERMRITNTGEVGIGTTAPSARLSIVPTSNPTSATGDLQTAIGEATNNGGYQLRMGYTSTYQGVINVIAGGGGAELLLNPSGGAVGIGTSSPGAKLEVSSTSAGATIEVLRLNNPGAGANTAAQLKFVAAGSNYGTITGGYGAAAPQMTFNLPAGGNYVWQGTSTEQMRLDASGNLLVGTTLNPNSRRFRVYGIAEFDGDAVSLTSYKSSGTPIGSSGQGNYVVSGGPADGFGIQSQTALVFGSGGLNERMRIDSVGNVRIGSSSGGSKLSVVSTLSTNLLIEKNSLPEAYNPGTFSSKNAYMPSGTQENWVSASSASTVSGYLIDITAYNAGSATDVYFGALAGPVVGAGGPANFVFGRRTGTQTWAETMRIDNVGNVGIGTTAPGYKLAVVGTLEVTAVKEGVFTITDGAINLDPNNGSIQLWTLGASRTPGQANWATGQSITLMIDDGAAYAVTWSTLAVVWKTNGGTAPTLNTSGFTIITLWKVGTTIYGARVGDA